jgi:hypothetical protein
MLKSCVTLLCPIKYVSYPLSTVYPYRIHYPPTSHLVAIWVNRALMQYFKLLVFKSFLFHLIMVPKHKNSYGGNLDIPKRSHKMLPLVKMLKF